ncbi:MAG: division plane positioning ATPase MipZ [Pseudomonadota bacterium]
MNKNNRITGSGDGASAHVIVCGNEKGGTGKTTTAFQIATALLKRGFSVATVDLDTRQRSFTRFVDNRRLWAQANGLQLELPSHFSFDVPDCDSRQAAADQEFGALLNAMRDLERKQDFVVIDTPGHDGYLMRLAHSIADTLVTPLNDSLLDLDVLARVEADGTTIHSLSHYALSVREARRERRSVDRGLLDWVVVRNRLTPIGSRNKARLHGVLQRLSMELGFRFGDGLAERVIYREHFSRGLTALDDPSSVGLGDTIVRPSDVAARAEVERLVESLRLPIDSVASERASARRRWMERVFAPVTRRPTTTPMDVDDLVCA